MIMITIGLALGASAQKVGGHGAIRYRPSTRVIVTPGIGFGYGFAPYYGWYRPWYGSPYGYDPFYYRSRPSRLDLQIEDIKVDYTDRIQSVRLNKDVPRKERRQQIRELKTERDKAIIQARRDYYYNRSKASRSSTKPFNNGDNNTDNNSNSQ